MRLRVDTTVIDLQSPISKFCCSDDGKLAMLASGRSAIALNLSEGKVMQRFESTGRKACGVNGLGTIVGFGTRDGIVVHSIDGSGDDRTYRGHVETLPNPKYSEPYQLCLPAYGCLNAASADGDQFRVWNSVTLETLFQLDDAVQVVRDVSFLTDSYLAFAYLKTAVLVDLQSDDKMKVYAGPEWRTECVRFIGEEGVLLAASGEDEFVFLWDVNDPDYPKRLRATPDASTVGICSLDDGTRVAGISSSGDVFVWSPSSGNPVATLDLATECIGVGSDGKRTLFCTSSDGKVIRVELIQ